MNYFRKQKYSSSGFPIITEPLEHQGWWFWGALGLSCGLWGLIIWGACNLA